MNKILFIHIVSLTIIYSVNCIESQPQNEYQFTSFNDSAIDNISANDIPQSRSSKNDEINVVEGKQSVTMTELGRPSEYAVQPEDQKIEYNLHMVNLSPILGEDAQQQVEIENKRDLSFNQKNMRNFQLQENLQQQFERNMMRTLQNQFDLIYPNSQVLVGSQFKFQFDKFGDGFSHEIENVKRIEGNNQRDLENKILPNWLYYDQANRIFIGRVPEQQNKISYEITIEFSSGMNKTIDRFLFHINKNIGIYGLELVGSISTGAQGASSFEIKGKIYALLANFFGDASLQIIEVSDPQNPVLVGSISTGGQAYGVSSLEIGVKIYAMVACDNAGLQIIEVSDPQEPVLVRSISTGGQAQGVSSFEIGVKIYALVANGNAGLQIIEVSDPQKPLTVGNISTSGNANGVSTVEIEGIIYALVTNWNASLKIIDVSDPQKPLLVGSISTGGRAWKVSSLEIGVKIYALVACDYAGLEIIEVSDPQNPVLVRSIRTGGIAQGVSSLEIGVKIYALVANGRAGLQVIEVSDPYNPVLVSSIATGGNAQAVSTLEIGLKIYALVANGNAGLQIIHIQLSNNYRNYFLPISNTKILTGGQAYGVSSLEIKGIIYALLANGNAGLQIIEVSDPQNPVLVRSISTGGQAQGVSSFEIGVKIYALMACNDAGLKIIEVSDPQNPVVVGNISTGGLAQGVSTVEIKGIIYALLANGDAGLQVIEVRDPQNPVLVRSISTDGQALGVSSFEIGVKIYALVANGYAGLEIIEVSDPQNPVLVRSIRTGGIAQGVSSLEIGVKIYALVAIVGRAGLQVIEVSDPYNPVLVSSIATGGVEAVITLEIGVKIYALVANGNAGLQIIEVSDPQKPLIVGYISTGGNAMAVGTVEIGGNIYACVANQNPGDLNIIKITDNIALYPSISSTIKLQIREIKINLYPINTKTLYAFSEENILLSLSIIKRENKQLSPLPYWLSTYLEEKIMIFVPISKESLEQIRYIHYTFSTKVKQPDLDGISTEKNSDIVLRELIKQGYIDPNLFLTKFFNIDKDLILDPSFNKSAIKAVLSRYYYEGYFEMTMEDFLEQSESPKIKEGELQRQFDSKGKTKVRQKIDFQFLDSTFTHPDEDPLTFSITYVEKRDSYGNVNNTKELPVWLNFDRGTRRFQGTPGIEDLGQYIITVQATKQYKEVSQNFTISLTNNAPTVEEEIPDQYKSLKLVQNYDYIFSESLFQDRDNDTLNYQAEIIYTPKGKYAQKQQLLLTTGDFWMKFDSQYRHFTGKPQLSDINNNTKGYNQTFTIKITATDIANTFVSKEFNLTVYKLAPQAQNSIKNYTALIQQPFTFIFDKYTFNAGDEDDLKYRAEQTNDKLLPPWLVFIPGDRKFEGTPPDQQEDIHIRLIATDEADQSIWVEFVIIFEVSTLLNAQQILATLVFYGKYAGYIVTIYTLYKLRALFYEFFFKKYYQYFRIEKAIVGEEYNKKIPLIREDIVKAFKLWEILKKNTIRKIKSKRENSCINEICWQLYYKFKVQNNWFELEFMNDSGEIKQKNLADALHQTNFSQQKKMQLTMFDLKRIINGQIANMLIEKNKSTKKIYNILKKNSSNNSPLDWYIEYIKKLHNNNELIEEEIIQINDDILEKNLSTLDTKDTKFNKNLLIDKILSDARGISEISRLQPSKGETIHVYCQEIKTVKAQQKIKNIIGLSLGKRIKRKLTFFKLNYIDINMIDNRKLPKWLNVEIEDNTLHLWGTPKKEDREEIMIQIIDRDNFVLREFWIRVYENQEMVIENLRLTNSFSASEEENIETLLISIN